MLRLKSQRTNTRVKFCGKWQPPSLGWKASCEGEKNRGRRRKKKELPSETILEKNVIKIKIQNFGIYRETHIIECSYAIYKK